MVEVRAEMNDGQGRGWISMCMYSWGNRNSSRLGLGRLGSLSDVEVQRRRCNVRESGYEEGRGGGGRCCWILTVRHVAPAGGGRGFRGSKGSSGQGVLTKKNR